MRSQERVPAAADPVGGLYVRSTRVISAYTISVGEGNTHGGEEIVNSSISTNLN